MAFFTASASIAAGASLNPLDVSGGTWKYNRAPYDALVEIICNATLGPMLLTLTAGSDEIVQSCPVSLGGVAGVLPARLGTEPITFTVKAGDVIQPTFRNTNAGAATLNFTIEMTRK
jgi:hypothetical protein